MAEAEQKTSPAKLVAGVCCPCCCHEKYRFNGKGGKCPVVGCLACCIWTILIIIALYFVIVFAVLKPVVCDMLSSELFPDDEWLEFISTVQPDNYEFAGSQNGCLSWKDYWDIEDWRVQNDSYEEVFFKSTDGLDLHGYWFKGQGGTIGDPSRAPTIIQVHGHGPHVSTQSEIIPAKAMSMLGFNVFAFNNRGLGKSQKPTGSATRSFGIDEMWDTEGAIEYVKTKRGKTLDKIGIYTSSGGNGMLWFFRKDIPGIVMMESIYDWFVRFKSDAGAAGNLPLFSTIIDQCIDDATATGGVSDNNYKDGLNGDVFDPSGRKVLLIHNKGDEYNLFENNAPHWEKDLKAKGFSVETYFPSEVSPEKDCNNHITLPFGPGRKIFFQEMCEFWETTFSVNANCSNAAYFDRYL